MSPPLLRLGANPSFHEGMGELISLASGQTPYLKQVGLLKSDQFSFPVVIRPPTYAWAGVAVLASGLASALVVRRRIDRLDMVSALKARD